MNKVPAKINDVVEISKLSHDGRGIGVFNNKKIFVRGALPAEKVSFRLLKKRSKYYEAEAIEVLGQEAPLRVEPPCDHASLCGGCSLQHMHSDAQLELKQKTLLEHLQQFGHVSPEDVLPTLSADTLGYRHKARLGVKFVEKKNKLLIGFREKASRYLADINECAVLHPVVGKHLPQLASLIQSLTQFRSIPQVEVAIGEDACALVFRHLEPLPPEDIDCLISFARTWHFHIYLQPNKPDPLVKLWPQDGVERLSYTLPQQALTYRFHPLDFTQINPSINQPMVSQALALLALKSDDYVLDLFCGIGNFTLPIAQTAHHVTGVEGCEKMVERAYENAELNQVTNVEFVSANLAEPIISAPWLSKQFNKILIDPPRTGACEILEHIQKLQAERIVYVSCNSATLARDAGILVHKQGFHLAAVGMMNMFPHTTHSEAIALFTKG